MSFINPWYLVGLLAVGLPVLIHILQRDLVRRRIFPAVRFLLGAKKITRTQLIRQLLLLILRVVAVLILVLAVARPFYLSGLDKAAATAQAAKAGVLLVDVSGSMQIGNKMEEVLKAAREALASYHPQIDRVALVAFDQAAATLVAPTGEPQQVADALANLKAGFGGTDLLEALQYADRILLADEYKNCAREIVLCSDLQKSGWSGFKGDWHLSPGVQLFVHPTTRKPVENAAIRQVVMPTSTVMSPLPELITMQVLNFGKQEYRDVKLDFTLKGKKLDEKLVNLAPGKPEVVRFSHKFETAGDYQGTLTMDLKDDFPAGHTFYFNVHVLPKVQVLLLNGGAGKARLQDDAFFLRHALALPGSPFAVTEMPPEKATPQDLHNVNAVVLANVPSLSESVGAALKAFIDAGGGVLIFPGDRVAPEVFNQSLAGIAPCKLKQIEAKPGKSEGNVIAEVDLQHPIFRLFAMPQSGEFGAVHFAKYATVTNSQTARVLARFIDGRPALLEQKIGNGYSLLFTSSAGASWNDFFLQGGIYVPFLHECLKYLGVRGDLLAEAQTGQRLALANIADKAQLVTPAGVTIPLTASAPPVLRAPGIYTLQQGEQSQYIAVNVPAAESEPDLLDSQELAQAVNNTLDAKQVSEEGGSILVANPTSVLEKIEKSQHWGLFLLLALGILLFAEHILANQTSRH